MKIEEWRDIEEFKGLYQVSNLGRVRSVERHSNTRTYPAQIMRQYEKYSRDKICGAVVHLRKPTVKYQLSRSGGKLVAETFLGKAPKNAKQIKHKDGNGLNNTLDNIEWDIDKSYYAPFNAQARNLFDEYAYIYIRKWVSDRDLWQLKYGAYDIDDLIQECAISIYNVIDIYNESHCKFITFVYTKCDWVFTRKYAKYKQRERIAPTRRIESQLVTEETPLDHISELSYLEDYDL